MIAWIVIFLVLVGLQFTVLARGAPYLPTLKKHRRQALDLLDLKPGQTLIDLGSGDGSVLAEAAERGIYAVGYEINPLLVAVARLKLRRHKKLTKVVWGNFWRKKWPPADGVFVFLTGKYMDKLDEQMQQRFAGDVKLVTYGFQLKSREPAKKAGAFFLYKYK